MRRGDGSDFEAQILKVARAACEDVVAAGAARVEEGKDDDGIALLRLVPANPRAASLTILADYPTLAMGEEGHTTEMFGSEATRLRELARLIRAVIAGRYEWRHRQVTRRFLFWRFGPFTQLVGTFRTEDGPWVFTREGFEPPGTRDSGTYEPYFEESP